jgi:enoyl-CoA hydratase/carnithine racemase
MSASTDTVKFSVTGSTAEIEINRPEKKNALTQAMYTAMADAFSQADADPAVRVIVIRGQPNIFTSGNDLKDFMNFDTLEPFESGPIYRFLRAISGAAKPVIAAVNGAAVGIGTTLLLHCELVYAAENAMFQMPFVSLGICPEAAASFLLPKLAGYQRAANLLLLGEPFGALQAKEIGLVNEVLPEGEVVSRALARAKQLAAQPPGSVRITKQLLKAADAATVLRVMSEEGRQFIDRLNSAEAKEAFTAFMEKRKPDFSRFA